MAELEAAVGRRFGDADDPLLVSVRSGAPVSMPGMMDTILDLGLNDATTAGLARATGDEAFAAELSRAVRVELPVDRRRRRGAGRPVAAAPSRHRGRVPVLAERSRRRLPREGGHPRRPRHGRDRPGDGLRQPRRRLGDRASCSPAIRRPARTGAVRRHPVRRAGRGRRRRHASRPSRSRSSTSGCRRSPRSCAPPRTASSATTPTCATSSSPSSRAGCGCSRSGSASAARRRRCGSPSTWPRTQAFPLTRAEAVARVAPAAGGSAAVRDDPQPSRAAHRDRSAGLARDGERADRHRSEAAVAAAEAGTPRHPRPCRDLAGRRPRDGRRGRHPDVARRSREPRGGRGSRLGHPGGRRRGRRGGR